MPDSVQITNGVSTISLPATNVAVKDGDVIHVPSNTTIYVDVENSSGTVTNQFDGNTSGATVIVTRLNKSRYDVKIPNGVCGIRG